MIFLQTDSTGAFYSTLGSVIGIPIIIGLLAFFVVLGIKMLKSKRHN